MLKTEKQEHSNRIETQSNWNRNTTHPNNREQTLNRRRRMMSEKKTKGLSLKNQEWKIVKSETKKNEQIINTYLNEHITELNELIYAGAKLLCIKIGVPQNNTYRNLKH